jgi:hypothetical protein
MQWTARRFPALERHIRDLVGQHRELRDEPLHLALIYGPSRDSRDVFVFELLGNFGGNLISPDAELFEVTFGASTSFPLQPGQELHLVLSNPVEFRTALAQRWSTAEEIRDAVRHDKFEELYSDEIGKKAVELLREPARAVKKATKTRKAAAKVSAEQANERASSMASTSPKRQRKRGARP